MTIMNDDERWQAVCDRRGDLRGAFVLGVITTGIYCVPGCPAKRPLRRNVRFFADARAAEDAGFRACKRCRPNEAGEDQGDSVIEAACRQILDAEMEPDLATLAASAGLSQWHFQRRFKAVTGLTPKRFAKACRDQRLRRHLASASNVIEAFFDSGFETVSSAYAGATARLGMAPGQYRKKGLGVRIGYVSVPTSLGNLLLAATDKGVCSISFEETQEDLEARFPAARIERDKSLTAMAEQAVAMVEQPAESNQDLPLDLRGTVFQMRVWDELRKLRVGETVTYAQLAERMGSPRSTRAVASACARNKVAVAVPCHRVVRSDGGLGGYRWEIERKRELIEREAEATAEESGH